jgi:hypothetical protein
LEWRQCLGDWSGIFQTDRQEAGKACVRMCHEYAADKTATAGEIKLSVALAVTHVAGAAATGLVDLGAIRAAALSCDKLDELAAASGWSVQGICTPVTGPSLSLLSGQPASAAVSASSSSSENDSPASQVDLSVPISATIMGQASSRTPFAGVSHSPEAQWSQDGFTSLSLVPVSLCAECLSRAPEATRRLHSEIFRP